MNIHRLLIGILVTIIFIIFHVSFPYDTNVPLWKVHVGLSSVIYFMIRLALVTYDFCIFWTLSNMFLNLNVNEEYPRILSRVSTLLILFVGAGVLTLPTITVTMSNVIAALLFIMIIPILSTVDCILFLASQFPQKNK